MAVPMRGYPFDRLPALSRAEVQLDRPRSAPLRALLRGAEPAGDWLGAPVRIEVLPPKPAPATEFEPLLAALLEHEHTRAALLLDPLLAHALVERTLGGEDDPRDPALGPLTELEQGVLVYALARWLAGADSAFRVAALLTTWPALDEALGASERVRWPLVIHVGATRGQAALLASDTDEGAFLESTPAWAEAIPVELSVVAANATLNAQRWATLEIGDVVLPDRWDVRIEEGALTGRVTLAQARGPRAWTAALRENALEIVAEEPRVLESAAEVIVKDSGKPLEGMGETPVTLSVELGRLTLPLGELASLVPGDVVKTEVPVGTEVALRAGDRVIATGELVDVEGELGVRITRIAGA